MTEEVSFFEKNYVLDFGAAIPVHIDDDGEIWFSQKNLKTYLESHIEAVETDMAQFENSRMIDSFKGVLYTLNGVYKMLSNGDITTSDKIV